MTHPAYYYNLIRVFPQQQVTIHKKLPHLFPLLLPPVFLIAILTNLESSATAAMKKPSTKVSGFLWKKFVCSRSCATESAKKYYARHTVSATTQKSL